MKNSAELFVSTECGTVPNYTLPELKAEKEPAPLEKIVTCKQELTGNWIVVQQTRENEVLQFSEIEFLHGKMELVNSKIDFIYENLLVKSACIARLKG